jgi:hypothetical protein
MLLTMCLMRMLSSKRSIRILRSFSLMGQFKVLILLFLLMVQLGPEKLIPCLDLKALGE